MTNQDVFNRIYDLKEWGEGSGPGSDPDKAGDFLDWVHDKIAGPHSLIDIGCGDGRLARHIAPLFDNYIGVDISERAIQRHHKTTIYPSVRMDAADGEWRADIALIKDVLQHLPFQDCFRLLNAVRKCAHVVVINDVPDSIKAPDCQVGGYRPIDPLYFNREFKCATMINVGGFRKGVWEWCP